MEVAGATGDATAAADPARGLSDVAATFGTPGLLAAARQSAGAARLVTGQPERALPLLREACRQWRELGVRYHMAQTRIRLAGPFQAIGDREAD